MPPHLFPKNFSVLEILKLYMHPSSQNSLSFLTATANVHVDITTIRDTAREASGVGKVSSRPWKVPAKRASETKTNPLLKTSWDKKMAEKATRASFLEHKRSTLAVRKEKLKAETKRRAAVKEQKEANRLKSQVVQKVSTATAKKMMKDKKQRKKLVTA